MNRIGLLSFRRGVVVGLLSVGVGAVGLSAGSGVAIAQANKPLAANNPGAGAPPKTEPAAKPATPPATPPKQEAAAGPNTEPAAKPATPPATPPKQEVAGGPPKQATVISQVSPVKCVDMEFNARPLHQWRDGAVRWITISRTDPAAANSIVKVAWTSQGVSKVGGDPMSKQLGCQVVNNADLPAWEKPFLSGLQHSLEQAGGFKHLSDITEITVKGKDGSLTDGSIAAIETALKKPHDPAPGGNNPGTKNPPEDPPVDPVLTIPAPSDKLADTIQFAAWLSVISAAALLLIAIGSVVGLSWITWRRLGLTRNAFPTLLDALSSTAPPQPSQQRAQATATGGDYQVKPNLWTPPVQAQPPRKECLFNAVPADSQKFLLDLLAAHREADVGSDPQAREVARMVLGETIKVRSVLSSQNAWVIHALYSERARIRAYGAQYLGLLMTDDAAARSGIDSNWLVQHLGLLCDELGKLAKTEGIQFFVPEIRQAPGAGWKFLSPGSASALGKKVFRLAAHQPRIENQHVIDVVGIGCTQGNQWIVEPNVILQLPSNY